MENTRLVSQGLPKKNLWVLALVISFAILFLHILEIIKVFNSSPVLWSSLWIITWGLLLFYFMRIHKVTHPNSPARTGFAFGMAVTAFFILSKIWSLFFWIQVSQSEDIEFLFSLNLYVSSGFGALSKILFIAGLFCMVSAFRKKALQKSIAFALAICIILTLFYNYFIIGIIDPRTSIIPFLVSTLYYFCLIAFIIVTSLPVFVEWLASEDSIPPAPIPKTNAAGTTDYKPFHVFPNSFVAGTTALVLSFSLVFLSVLFETSRAIDSPIPMVIVAAIISSLMLILTFRNRKAQIALGIKKSIGGALICYSITLCVFWLCMIAAIVLAGSSSFRGMHDMEVLNILIIVGMIFLFFSIIFGFASSTKPADGVSVLALMPLLGLSMLSDEIASLLNGHSTLVAFADTNVYKITFFLFAIFNTSASIVHLATPKPKQNQIVP